MIPIESLQVVVLALRESAGLACRYVMDGIIEDLRGDGAIEDLRQEIFDLTTSHLVHR